MFEDPTGRDPYTAAQLVQKLLLQASFFKKKILLQAFFFFQFQILNFQILKFSVYSVPYIKKSVICLYLFFKSPSYSQFYIVHILGHWRLRIAVKKKHIKKNRMQSNNPMSKLRNCPGLENLTAVYIYFILYWRFFFFFLQKLLFLMKLINFPGLENLTAVYIYFILY